MGLRLLSFVVLAFLISGCGSIGFFKPATIPPSVSNSIPKTVLESCSDARCLLSFAKAQNIHSNKFERDLAKVGFAATHILLEEERQALTIIDSIQNEGIKAIFYKNFGSIDKDKISRFIADTQRWENVELPLPKSLLGNNENYDTLYAFFLALGGDHQGAYRLAKTLRLPTNRNKVLYLLTLHALKDQQFDQAFAFAEEIQSRVSRPRAYSFIYNALYKSGAQQLALDKVDTLNFSHDKDGARAGIAIAMASENAVVPALKITNSITTLPMRLFSYAGMLKYFALKGDLEQVQYVIEDVVFTDRQKIPYAHIVGSFAAGGHLVEAEEFLQDIPDDVQTIYALSELGKITGDSSYFQQSLVLAKAVQDREDSKFMKGTISLAANMAQAGFFEESIKTLHIYKRPLLRRVSRELIFKSLHSSPHTPKDYQTILDFTEQDLNSSEQNEYDQILKNATKLFLVNRADLKSLNRYLKLVDRVENKFNRETLYGRILPHLAYLGETDKTNEIIASMTHTMPRIWALLRLAEFHVLKKKINTI